MFLEKSSSSCQPILLWPPPRLLSISFIFHTLNMHACFNINAPANIFVYIPPPPAATQSHLGTRIKVCTVHMYLKIYQSSGSNALTKITPCRKTKKERKDTSLKLGVSMGVMWPHTLVNRSKTAKTLILKQTQQRLIIKLATVTIKRLWSAYGRQKEY